MIHKRTTKEVRRYDIFKLSIVLLLLVLIFLMLVRDNDSSTVATTEEGAISSEVADSTTSDTSEADMAEEAYPVDGDTTSEEDAASDTDADVAYPADEEAAGEENAESETPSEDAYPSDDDASGEEETAAEVTEPTLHTPAQNAELEAGTNLFSGSGEPGSTVRILVDGEELGQTTVDENGNWYLEAELEVGEPIIEVETIDDEGDVIALSQPLAITVNAPVEVAAEPELVLEDSNLYAGSVELSGYGEPGHHVVIFADGVAVGTAEVGEDGIWNYALDLEAGTYNIGLQTVDGNGDVVNESGPFEIVVEDVISPTVSLPADDVYTGGMTLSGTGQPGTKVQLYANGLVIAEASVDSEGNYTVDVSLATGRYDIDVATLDKDGSALQIIPALSLPVLALASAEFVFSDRELPEFDPLSGLVAFHGTADPEAQLALQVNGEAYSLTAADMDGDWAMLSDLGAGTYEIALAQLDQDGNIVSLSETVSVELGQTPPILSLPEHSIADSSGSEDLADQAIILPSGEFEWTGQGEPGETVAVIIDNEIVGTAAADADGNWKISTSLEAGDYQVQTGAVSVDGTIINQSAAVNLSVAAMSLPTMDVLQLDASGKGSVSGTADPDTIVNISANGKVVGITSPDENGDWTLNVDLGAGSFEVQAQILDSEGNIILSSEKQTVKVGASADSTGEDDVIDVTAAQSEFSILLEGLDLTGLTSQLSEIDKKFTLFAPTDEAFNALPDEIIMTWETHPEAYKDIALYLVLEGENTQIELVEKEVLTTLAGTNIGITTDDEEVLINGVPIEESLPAANGIVHAINQVILPPLGYQAKPPIIDISGVSIFTGDYLTVVGTAEPGTTILLQVSGENFGELAAVDDEGNWQASDDISSGVQEIVAYMLDENGLLMAISQQVNLPVQ